MWFYFLLFLSASPPSHPIAKTEALRVQVLLDRNHFSPGEIDGRFGRVTRNALLAFQSANRLPQTGRADAATMRKLEKDQEGASTLISYTITDDDERGPFVTIPDELMDQANLPALGYQSPLEELG